MKRKLLLLFVVISASLYFFVGFNNDKDKDLVADVIKQEVEKEHMKYCVEKKSHYVKEAYFYENSYIFFSVLELEGIFTSVFKNNSDVYVYSPMERCYVPLEEFRGSALPVEEINSSLVMENCTFMPYNYTIFNVPLC